MTWYAVHTRPGWEPAVDRGLKRAGFGTFYPYQIVTRWRKASAGKSQRREEIERPYMAPFRREPNGRRSRRIADRREIIH